MSENKAKTQTKEAQKSKIQELLETGKQKGVLSYKTIMETLQEEDLDQEQIEKVYEALEEIGDTVFTGNTGTNLCDFNVLYIPKVED